MAFCTGARDLALAEQALARIEAARETFAAAGHAYYETYHADGALDARAVVDRMRGTA